MGNVKSQRENRASNRYLIPLVSWLIFPSFFFASLSFASVFQDPDPPISAAILLRDGGSYDTDSDIYYAGHGPSLVKALGPKIPELERVAKAWVDNEMARQNVKVRAYTTSKLGTAWVGQYSLEYQGIPLAPPSKVTFIVDQETTRPMTMSFRRYPKQIEGVKPTVDANLATASAEADFNVESRSRSAQTETPKAGVDLLMTSTPRLEIWVDALGNGYLCWTFTIRGRGSFYDRELNHQRYWVRAIGKPTVLARQALAEEPRR